MPHRSARRPLVSIIALEPRLMFDGAAVAAAADHTDNSQAQQSAGAANALSQNSDSADTSHAQTAAEAAAAAAPAQPQQVQDSAPHEVAFVDPSVQNVDTLLAGLREGVEIVMLDPAKDQLSQIADWAKDHSGYDAIYVLGHGQDGTLLLGTLSLTAANVTDHGSDLAAIGSALTPDGDLLFYGCNSGAGTTGQALADALAAATGADVALSDDLTGAAARGGDWVLETQAGAIQAGLPFMSAVTDTYDGLLAATTITFDGPIQDDGSVSGIPKYVVNASYTLTVTTNDASDQSLITDSQMDGGNSDNELIIGVNSTSTEATIKFTNNEIFDLTSFTFQNINGETRIYTFTGMKNGVVVQTKTGSFDDSALPVTVTFTGFTQIDSVVITVSDGDAVACVIDDIVIDNLAPAGPTVTDARINIISTGSGTGGAYKIGDTVTATWNNTAAGDNNSGITGVTFDFSQFGGGSAVTATNSGGVWTASYTITAGSIDVTNRNVSVTATGSGTTTTADTTNLTVDNQAPTVTDGNIAISGGSGTSGAYKAGDTVTATWDNRASGDNNADTISGVTFDFSAFGGGSAVTATNSGGIWTATYLIAAGSIDATNRNVSVTVTDNAGNATSRADTTNATVDNQAPTVTDTNIAISGGSGTSGAYKVGDTVTATWDNRASGDNNTDTLSGVTFDFSAFGGGSAVAATNSGGIWTATYLIAAGSLNGVTNRNVSVTVTDNAGNATIRADTSNATVDNQVPTVTGVSSSTANGGYKAGDTISIQVSFGENVTVTGTPTLALNSGGTASYASGSGTGILTFTYVVQAGDTTADLDFSSTSALSGGTIRDASGNNATLTLPSPGAAGSLGANKNILIDTSIPAVTGVTSSTADGAYKSGATISIQVSFGENVTVTGTPTLALGNGGTASYTSGSGTGTLTFTYTVQAGDTSADLDFASTAALALAGGSIKDAGGNDASLTLASPGMAGSLGANKAIVIDTTAPADVALGAGPVNSATTMASGATIGTFTATDANTVTYSLASGSGDTDNAKFSLSGNTLTTTQALTAGTYSIRVKATDTAGNDTFEVKTITVVDAPSVTSIVRTGGATGAVPASATSVTFTVTFSEPVTNVDASDFTLTGTGTASGTIAAITGSGDTYTITVTGLSGDGTLRLDLNASGTGIQNGSSVTILGGYTSGEGYTLDHTAPATTNASSYTINGAYKAGETISIEVTFNENVTVTGTPTLALNSGGTAIYSGGSGTGTLTFIYTVQPGDSATDLDFSSATVSGGTITDAVGNIAVLPSPGAAGSLGDNKNIVIDAVAPSNITLSPDTVSPTATETADAIIGAFSATDSSTVTYQLVSGAGATDNDRFSIAGNTLKTTQPVPAGTYTIRVKATDAVGNITFEIKTITVATQTSNLQPPLAGETQTSNPQPPVQVPSEPAQVTTAPASDTGVGALQTFVRESGLSDKPAGMETVVRASGIGVVGQSESGAQTSFFSPPAASFQLGLAPKPVGGGDVLIVNTPIPDEAFGEGDRISVTIPANAFAHSSDQAVVNLQAVQANGAALPGWLAFNPRTGTFEGTPPPGFKGAIAVKVVARDRDGREAVQTFNIVVGRSNADPAERGQVPGRSGQAPMDGNRHAALMPAGRPSLTDQLRSMSQEGRIAQQMALFGAKGGGKAA